MAAPTTIPVRDAHRFDETRLAQWMGERIPGFAGPIQVEQFSETRPHRTARLIRLDSAANDHAVDYPGGSCPRNTSHPNKPFCRSFSDQ